jgi:hypothetical protein
MPQTLDEDTKKELSDGEEVANLLQSRGWGVIYGKLSNRLLDLQNINNLDLEKPETLAMQLMARKMAVDEIWVWLRSDVFGYAEQQATNAQALLDPKDEGYINRG